MCFSPYLGIECRGGAHHSPIASTNMPRIPIVLCVGLVTHLRAFGIRPHLASIVHTYISNTIYCVQRRVLQTDMQVLTCPE